MPPQKVFFRGSNANLLRTLRASGGGSLQVEQISESLSFKELARMADVGMLVLQHEPPASDSFASLRNWQRENPDVPVLVLTSDYTPDTTKFLMRSGAKEVLPLPVDGDKVLACYEAFLPGFRHVPQKTIKSRKKGLKTGNMLLVATAPGIVVAGVEMQASVLPEHLNASPAVIEQSVENFYNGLEVNYFGLLKVRLNGKKIDFNWQAKMLFGYLAYHSNKSLSRDHLARVFWPEKQESQPESARRSLNVELNHIRKAIRQQTGLQRELIVFEKNCYRLQLDRPMLSDVATFKSLCQKIQMLQREGHPVPDELFQQAIQTYSSNFLDDCPEDALNWVEVERQHLGALFEQLADLYSAQLCEKGEYYRATSVCHEILTRDQRMEAIHRRLMFCYGKLGMCNKVGQQYRLLCQIMEREFQSKPSAETTRLYQQIKTECE
ncbi:MAG: BTAD domain-containing putative transcriptional regulator [Saprospiraceae bacterium]